MPSIDSSLLAPFSNLLHLENKLVSLNGDLFQHSRKLQTIYLDGNLLEHVRHDLLAGLTYLTSVYFEANPCINTKAHAAQQIQELNRQLPIQCPPLDTTKDPPTTTTSTTSEPNECSPSCTSSEGAQEMKKRIEALEKVVAELRSIHLKFNFLAKAKRES